MNTLGWILGSVLNFVAVDLQFVSYPSIAAVSWLTYEILGQFQTISWAEGLAVDTVEQLMLTSLNAAPSAASKSNVMNGWLPPLR